MLIGKGNGGSGYACRNGLMDNDLRLPGTHTFRGSGILPGRVPGKAKNDDFSIAFILVRDSSNVNIVQNEQAIVTCGFELLFEDLAEMTFHHVAVSAP